MDDRGPLPGKSALVWFAWPNRPGLPKDVVGSEVLLTRPANGAYVLAVDQITAFVRPDTDRDGLELERAFGGTASRVVVAAEAVTSKEPHKLGVLVHRYDRGPQWPAVVVGVEDKAIQTVSRLASNRSVRTPAQAIRWLQDRLVLAPASNSPAGTSARVIVSAGPRGDLSAPVAFRVHGRGIEADVRTVDDRLVVQRVKRPTRGDEIGALKLVRCDLVLDDQSRATRMREETKRQLNRLAGGEGFLAMWHEYNRLESRLIRTQVRDTGYVQYQSAHVLVDGTIRFTVDEAPPRSDGQLPVVELARQAVLSGEELELEAATDRPNVLMGDELADSEWGLVDEGLGRDTVSGTVVRADVAERTIDFRPSKREAEKPGIGGSRPAAPPPCGVLYRSFRGSRRSLLRRRQAFERILRGVTHIPNLLALLEGDPVEAEWRPPVAPLSAAARRCFAGEPKPMQVEALRVALNTPDIAVIQGPPGTGKTQVITALQTRLAEVGRAHRTISGSMLLTSYQHAAVDEMVSRSRVDGIPPEKIDRLGRGTTEARDTWRRELVKEVGATVDRLDAGPVLVALRQVAAIVAGYLVAPLPPEGTVRLLHDVDRLCVGLLPVNLADEVRRRRIVLEASQRIPLIAHSDEHELALRAVRGLRTLPASFVDDGPAAAAKAVRRLAGLVDDHDRIAEHLDLLRAASAWAESEPPPFLADLATVQRRLLDLLAAPAGPIAEVTVDPSLRQLLQDVVAELEDQARRSEHDGVVVALLDYLEGLEGDPAAVDWTHRQYTASFAATCQQVSSPAMCEAKSETNVDDVVFDTVIVDEAARANPLDLMIPLIHAGRRIILVGDHQQLPQMLEPDVEREFERLDSEVKGRLRESLFERLFTGLNKPGMADQRVVTLDTQFRMHPVLGSFVSRSFYDNRLESPRPAEEFAHSLPGYGAAAAAWLSVPYHAGPEHGGRSKFRRAEAQRIAAELQRLLAESPDLTFGVIAFYRSQVREIWQELAKPECGLARRADHGYEIAEHIRHDSSGRALERLRVGTVDAFQGNEFDVVFLSVTRSSARREPRPPVGTAPYRRWLGSRYGHLILKNRLCVAMSRQKRLLVAVGDQAMFEPPEAPAEIEPLTGFLRLCREGEPHGRVVQA